MKSSTTTLSLARELGKLLLLREETLATAESCTGGLLAAAVTALSGSSAWFKAGWVTYSIEAKAKQLDIPHEKIILHGAVSQYTVTTMARQARQLANTTWAIAISGVAGPLKAISESPSDQQKAVGTVWVAVAGPAFEHTFVSHLTGTRTQIRKKALALGLSYLVKKLKTKKSVVLPPIQFPK